MDGFSFHPYPNRVTDPLERGYNWPNAGFANLGRIKQELRFAELVELAVREAQGG